MIGIKWFDGCHALLLMIISILVLGTEIGLCIGIAIIFLDITYDLLRKEDKTAVETTEMEVKKPNERKPKTRSDRKIPRIRD